MSYSVVVVVSLNRTCSIFSHRTLVNVSNVHQILESVKKKWEHNDNLYDSKPKCVSFKTNWPDFDVLSK